MKKIISSILCSALVFSLLSGCGAADSATDNGAQATVEATSTETSETAAAVLDKSGVPQMSMNVDFAANYKNDYFINNTTSTSTGTVDGVASFDNVDYVMIYNPFIFDEMDTDITKSSLYTGDFSSQINIGTGRADGPDLEVSPLTIPTMNSVDFEYQKGGRAGGIVDTYEEGDKELFFYDKSLVKNQRAAGEFTCEYSGEYCYIWSIDGSITSDFAKDCGEQFDENIYEQDVEAFGEPRFVDDGGKVNLLFFPIDVEGVGGFFSLMDLFSYGEVSAADIITYGLNTDRAIINVNSDHIGVVDDKRIYATMSHEFQHLICATDTLENGSVSADIMASWLNESMSAYAEELIYPGIKEEGLYNVLFYPSDNFRKGQSLYNFSTENDEFIGAYSAVYLFEKYLRRESGDDTLSKIHNYWRTTSNNFTEGDAIMASVPSDFLDKIDESVTYPDVISKGFGSDSEEWISKLAFNFYLETLSTELGSLDMYEGDMRDFMIYDELSPAEIEGGGRIIIATQDHTYTIPDDASDELVYVGLDKDYNVITDMITKDSVDGGASDTATTDADTGMDTSGYNTDNAEFTFKWNGNLTSYVYIPSKKANSIGKAFDDCLQAVGVNAAQITIGESLADIAADITDKGISGSNTGFVTIVFPATVSADEAAQLEGITAKLVSQGVYVTYICNEFRLPAKQYCVMGFADKLVETDYFASIDANKYGISLAAYAVNALFDMIEDNKPAPAIGMFE